MSGMPTPGPVVTVIRHGETTWSSSGQHTGRTDLDLTATGEEQAAALRPLLALRHFDLVAVSPQKPDGSLSAQEKNDLPFPVLSDPGNRLAGELGILMAPRSDDVRAAQEKLGLKLEARMAPTKVLVIDHGEKLSEN